MKTKLIKFAFAGAIAIMAGINVFNALKPAVLSDVVKENVEALAYVEEGDKIKCYSSLEYELGSVVVECSTCQAMMDRTDKWYSLSDTCTRNT